MSRERLFRQRYLDLKQAAGLLEDENLIWSDDLEAIRRPLAKLLHHLAPLGDHAPESAVELAQTLIAEENDLTV